MSSDKRENEKLNVNFTVTNPKEKFEISNELIKMCISNLEYYKKDKSFAGSKIHSNFEKFKKLLESSIPVIKEIESFSHLYDYDENTPGNGYRSFVYIFECALKYSKKIFDYITEHRASLLFRKNLYLKYVSVLTRNNFKVESALFITNKLAHIKLLIPLKKNIFNHFLQRT